jgi:hypothetical protein
MKTDKEILKDRVTDRVGEGALSLIVAIIWPPALGEFRHLRCVGGEDLSQGETGRRQVQPAGVSKLQEGR